MDNLEKLDIILSAKDRGELARFHSDVAKCSLAGHDFETCLGIIYASRKDNVNIDIIMKVMEKRNIPTGHIGWVHLKG